MHRQGRVEMTQEQGSTFGNRCVQAIAVDGGDGFFLPDRDGGYGQMAELFGEGSVVVAAYCDEFGGAAEVLQKMFDPGSFGIAGARCVDHIAQEDDTPGLEFFAQSEELFAGAFVN